MSKLLSHLQALTNHFYSKQKDKEELIQLRSIDFSRVTLVNDAYVTSTNIVITFTAPKDGVLVSHITNNTQYNGIGSLTNSDFYSLINLDGAINNGAANSAVFWPMERGQSVNVHRRCSESTQAWIYFYPYKGA